MSNLVELLPQRITANPAWEKLANSVQEIINSEVWEPTSEINKLRKPQEIEYEYLALLGKLLGLNLGYKTIPDHPYFTENHMRRIVESIYEYYSSCGTTSLEKIMSYGLTTPIKIKPLWSENYTTFVEQLPEGATTIYGGGTWFPTPHVNIEAGLERMYYDDWESEIPGEVLNWSFEDIHNFFIELAPIHLVLETIVQKLRAVTDLVASIGFTMRIVYPVNQPNYFLNIGVVGPMRIRL